MLLSFRNTSQIVQLPLLLPLYNSQSTDSHYKSIDWFLHCRNIELIWVKLSKCISKTKRKKKKRKVKIKKGRKMNFIDFCTLDLVVRVFATSIDILGLKFTGYLSSGTLMLLSRQASNQYGDTKCFLSRFASAKSFELSFSLPYT